MPSRRAVLGAGLAAPLLAVAGCRAANPAPAPRPPGDPDAALLARARSGEQRLLAAYDAVLARHPGLRTALAPLRGHHLAHLRALGGQPRSPRAAAAAADPAAAVRALGALERQAALARGADCLAASGGRTGLLGSIAAAETAHAVVLAAVGTR